MIYCTKIENFRPITQEEVNAMLEVCMEFTNMRHAMNKFHEDYLARRQAEAKSSAATHL